MSRVASSKTAKIWAERIAQCERTNAPVAQFCQSIVCWPMFSPRGVVQRCTTDFQSVGQIVQVNEWVRRTGSPSYEAIKTQTRC